MFGLPNPKRPVFKLRRLTILPIRLGGSIQVDIIEADLALGGDCNAPNDDVAATCATNLGSNLNVILDLPVFAVRRERSSSKRTARRRTTY